MFPIEMIGNFARILSLSMRLFGNIFGEHTATGIFMGMLPFVLPWPMMGLGIFGAFLQTFVFIMLTMVYISGAIAAEEH
jgi:F-type H+-transporting ATPase subunit a